MRNWVKLENLIRHTVIFQESAYQINLRAASQQSVFAPIAWVVPFWEYLFPDEGRFLFVEGDGVEVTQRPVKHLVAPVDIKPASKESYLLLKEQAAL